MRSARNLVENLWDRFISSAVPGYNVQKGVTYTYSFQNYLNNTEKVLQISVPGCKVKKRGYLGLAVPGCQFHNLGLSSPRLYFS